MAGLVISASQLRKLRPREVQGHTRGKGWSRIQTQTSGCPLGAHTALRLLFPTPPPPVPATHRDVGAEACRAPVAEQTQTPGCWGP